MTNTLSSRPLRWALVGLLVGLVATALFQVPTAQAYFYRDAQGDLLFRWEDSSAVVCDEDTSWATEAEEAADDFNDNTDLTVTWTSSCSNSHDIANREWDYGITGWIGFAYTFTDGGTTPCWNWEWTDDCNTTDHKADYAYIIWNTYSGYAINEPDWQARHELGHVFALRHPAGSTECSTPEPSVMIAVTNPVDGDCDEQYETLQNQDITDINGQY